MATQNQAVHDTLVNVLVHVPKPCDVGLEPTPSTLSMEHLRTFITRCHSTDVNCTVCQDQLAFGDTCCKMLCKCKEACWIHSNCLATQINIGHHSNSNCLMRCGACRESLWGQQCEQNFNEVAVLLNRRFDVSNQLGSLHDAQRAYTVALDCARTLVRLGGGSIGNPLLGVALCSIASAMFEIDRHTNNRVDPERFRSGELCYFSIMTLSTVASFRTLFIVQKMIAIACTDVEKKIWCNKVTECIQRFQCQLPDTLVKQHVKLELGLLGVAIQTRPSRTSLGNVRFDSNIAKRIENWTWNICDLNIETCLLVCTTLEKYDLVRHMKSFLEYGMRANPTRFQLLKDRYDQQIKIDVAWFTTCMKEKKITDVEKIQLGDWFSWDATLIDPSVASLLIAAHDNEKNCSGRYQDFYTCLNRVGCGGLKSRNETSDARTVKTRRKKPIKRRRRKKKERQARDNK